MDFVSENEELRQENEFLTKLLEESMERMEASVNYWRNQYMIAVQFIDIRTSERREPEIAGENGLSKKGRGQRRQRW